MSGKASTRPGETAPAPDPGKAEGTPDASFGELVSTENAELRPRTQFEVTALGQRLAAFWLPVAWKPLLTGVLLVVLCCVPYVVPGLDRYRVLTDGVSFWKPRGATDAVPGMEMPEERVGESSLPGPTDDSQLRGAELDQPLPDNRGPIAQARVKIPDAVLEGKPPISIEDPTGHALDKFFDKLIAVENKTAGSTARIIYYGDSIVASDFITGKLRRMYQDRFGDAGHGYAIAANAFAGWFHIDVSRKSSSLWKTSRCIGPYAEDGLYGLGCASFTARKEGEWFLMGTSTADKWGRRASRFEIEYLEQPGGGGLELVLDGNVQGKISTDGPEKKIKYHVVEAPDGEHKLEVKTTSDDATRVFGIRMERDVPGVTLSALGITGARARFLDKQDDAHWAETLKAAKPDLVVLAFGTNEVGDGMMAFDEKGMKVPDAMAFYEEKLKLVMKQVMAALPDASYMLVGPPDMASKEDGGGSKPMVPILIKHQKNCADELGWAYWNQYKAMGGGGSMASWVAAGLGNPDMIHPTGQGGNVLGKMQYLAVMEKYEAYKDSKR